MKRFLIVFVFITNIVILVYAQSNNYGNGNGTVIETMKDGDIIWIIRKHIQTVNIGDLSEDLNIYNKPVLGIGTVIGKLKINDNINITQVAEAIISNEYCYCLKISTENNINGWIYCGKYEYIFAQFKVPYFNNRWEIIENIKIGKKSWTIRKMIYQLVEVWEVLNIRDRPGLVETNVISKIIPPENGNSQVNLDVIEATEERETIDGRTDKWLKINYHGVVGWIFGGYASVERGGPKYYTPENIINFRLGWH